MEEKQMVEEIAERRGNKEAREKEDNGDLKR